MSERMSLKWGTLKSWHVNEGSPAYEALRRYVESGISWSAMQHRDTPEQKAMLCEAIDALDAETVYLDWDGEAVSKDEAKQYVLNYGKEDQHPAQSQHNSVKSLQDNAG